MPLISINLLPEQFIVEQTKKLKFVRIQSISIALLLLTFFLASLTVALRILQNQRVNQVQGRLTEIENQISGYRSVEDNIILLKSRVDSISRYLGSFSKDVTLYDYIEKNIPSQISINSLSIDKNGDSFLTIILADAASLDSIVNGLIAASNEKIKINQVDIDGLSRGKDGNYRVTLRLKSK